MPNCASSLSFRPYSECIHLTPSTSITSATNSRTCPTNQSSRMLITVWGRPYPKSCRQTLTLSTTTWLQSMLSGWTTYSTPIRQPVTTQSLKEFSWTTDKRKSELTILATPLSPKAAIAHCTPSTRTKTGTNSFTIRCTDMTNVCVHRRTITSTLAIQSPMQIWIRTVLTCSTCLARPSTSLLKWHTTIIKINYLRS